MAPSSPFSNITFLEFCHFEFRANSCRGPWGFRGPFCKNILKLSESYIPRIGMLGRFLELNKNFYEFRTRRGPQGALGTHEIPHIINNSGASPPSSNITSPISPFSKINILRNQHCPLPSTVQIQHPPKSTFSKINTAPTTTVAPPQES